MNIELERYAQAERDLQMFTEDDEEFYWTEHLRMEIDKPSSQCIKQIKAHIQLYEDYKNSFGLKIKYLYYKNE